MQASNITCSLAIPISGASIANTKDECEAYCCGASVPHGGTTTTGSKATYPIYPTIIADFESG
jgi:hypothetical protein